MVRAKGLLVDRQRTFEERLSLGVATLVGMQQGEIVEASGDGQVVEP